ncbi:acid phosphatase [Salvia divinorum]|uniref:Acid phosphatase n=1 Tax=Salvia divinorum TaxID=28513 RepID=A0ABD1G8M5_SALDI
MLRMDRMRIVVIFVIALIHVSNGDLQRIQHPTKADGSIQVLVLGDWGRKGAFNQSQLAIQMGITTEKMNN